MAEKDTTTTAKSPVATDEVVNTALEPRVDRVAMLSVRADGTPDQTNPVFLDPEFALAATKRQFAEQAVGSYDSQTGTPAVVDDAPQDPSIAEAQAKHEDIAKAAEAAAEAVVGSLTPKD